MIVTAGLPSLVAVPVSNSFFAVVQGLLLQSNAASHLIRPLAGRSNEGLRALEINLRGRKTGLIDITRVFLKFPDSNSWTGSCHTSKVIKRHKECVVRIEDRLRGTGLYRVEIELQRSPGVQ